MIVDNVKKHEICTGKLMKQVTGLTFCQNIKFPNASLHKEAPFFPFTGPVVYDLYMINEDAPNGYQIEAFSKVKLFSSQINKYAFCEINILFFMIPNSDKGKQLNKTMGLKPLNRFSSLVESP